MLVLYFTGYVGSILCLRTYERVEEGAVALSRIGVYCFPEFQCILWLVIVISSGGLLEDNSCLHFCGYLTRVHTELTPCLDSC